MGTEYINTVSIGVWKLHYRFSGALVMTGSGKQALETMSTRYCTMLYPNRTAIWFPTWRVLAHAQYSLAHAQHAPMSHLCSRRCPLTSNRARRSHGLETTIDCNKVHPSDRLALPKAPLRCCTSIHTTIMHQNTKFYANLLC